MFYFYIQFPSIFFYCIVSYGYTALHWAAQSGNIELVRLLLNNGAKKDVMTYSVSFRIFFFFLFHLFMISSFLYFLFYIFFSNGKYPSDLSATDEIAQLLAIAS